MIYLDSDYNETAYPLLLEKLLELKYEKNTGYGRDRYSLSAAKRIAAACEAPNAAVHFLLGGTQTNATVIDALLQPYEGAIAADTGHIAGHEVGAIERTGHKVITIPGEKGKITPGALIDYLLHFFDDASWEHMVQPGLVYISQPTEYGTLYTKGELTALRGLCDEYSLRLYVDGARLGYALAAVENDVDLKTMAQLCDAFYIGGTKVGAICGEAVVFPHPEIVPHFFSHIKQHGAMLAKGWILGIQFDTLFQDDLYCRLGHQGVEMAKLLKQGLLDKGYSFFVDSPTNQQFLITDQRQREKIGEHIVFHDWGKYDTDHRVIRLSTAWSTSTETINKALTYF